MAVAYQPISNAEMRDGKAEMSVGKDPSAPSAASAAEDTSWNAMLAVRSVLPTDPRKARMISCLTGSQTVHVDIVIRRLCTPNCPYKANQRVRCNMIHPIRHGLDKTGAPIVHRVTYTIRDGQADPANHVPADNYVACSINAAYLKNGGYTFIKLSMTDQQINRLEDFCRSQLGSYYSSLMCFAANELCCWSCLMCCDCSPCGVSTSELAKTGKIKASHQWFCSEFITAALIASGYMPANGLSPSMTTPGRLSEYITTDMKEPTIPRASAVAKEVLEYEQSLTEAL